MPPRRLSRLVPGSLLWRAFLLIAALMLLAVAAWLAIFREAEIEPRARQIAQMVASVANLTRAALLAARPAHRRHLLEEFSDTEGVHVYPADADDQLRPLPPTPLSRHLAHELRERLGPDTRIAFELNGEPGLFVSFRIFPGDAGEYWLALPRERLERRVRIEGRVVGSNYVVSHVGTLRTYTLDEARADRKLQSAIKRNGWQQLPE